VVDYVLTAEGKFFYRILMSLDFAFKVLSL
jgi:hypothetical protein